MRAIIISAGRGKRMGDLSDSLPKCLLEINGTTILRRQVDIFKACGIEDIVVIKGYKKELVNYSDLRYRINNNYLANNILNSLFCASDDIEGNCLITYGDILFRAQIVKSLISSRQDIVIVVDTNWKERYTNRAGHPMSEAEKAVMDSSKKLVEIGKILSNKRDAKAEFIGMMKVSGSGASILKDAFQRAKNNFAGKAFQRAKTFEQAYLTDMLQELVDHKIDVFCLCIDGGWLEVDTPQDYVLAKELFA
jgi:phosphoenolpyruvate phosphomutase